MTLTELMIEHTPPRVVGNTRERRHYGDWTGWLVHRLDWLSGHADWNRKI